MEGKVRRRRRSEEQILPAELLDEILVRVPLKSVIRFESVSKAWLSNLRSTLFKTFYEQRNNSYKPEEVHKMKLKDLYRMVPTLKQENRAFEPDWLPRWVSALGPLSNGIYCLASVPTNGRHQRDLFECQIVLCNPAICQFNLLPSFSSLLPIQSMNGINIVFGFCIVPGGLDYRVVAVIRYGVGIRCNLVFVYSSHSGEWDKLVDHIPGEKTVGPSSATQAFSRGEVGNISAPAEVCSQTLLKGCWHWITVQSDQTYTVLSFDFAHQSIRVLEGPPLEYEGDDDSELYADVNVLHDHLALICPHVYCSDEFTDLSVWMMMDYGVKESWTRIFNVHTSYYGCIPCKLYSIVYSVDAKEEGGSDRVNIEKLFFVDAHPPPNEGIISFDHRGGHEMTSLRYNSLEDICLNIPGISSYKETLERPY